MIGKVTALLKMKQWFKHPRLEQISTSVDACAILENAYPIMKRSDDCGKLS